MLFFRTTFCRLPGLTRAGVLLAALIGATTATADTLTGTALIRERVALPPDVSFEAVIEDTARAGAPATPFARTVIENPGQSPIAFAITYDPANLDPRATYSLRATIRRDGQLLFTTDTVTPVLGEGGPAPVEVLMKMVRQDRSDAGGAAVGAHGLRLPATFRGTLPCADCEGIRHHLDLWPEQYYHMRRDWLEGDGETLRRDEIGRWYADPAHNAIVLYGASEMPLFWQIQGADRLRQMDMAGNPIDSDLDYTLSSDGTLEQTELEGVFLLGIMTHLADAAVFQECHSGVRYHIVQEGDYLALERAYLDARPAPGAPLKVHVEGGLAPRPAMEGPDRTSLIVDRFIKVLPGEVCDQARSNASLTDTYWRIDTLMGAPVRPQQNRREPHIVLQSGSDSGYRATVGCNQLIGRYDAQGDTLTFAGGASTMMACPPPLDALERQLRDILEQTAQVRLEGQTMALLDGAGAPIAGLTAVYLR